MSGNDISFAFKVWCFYLHKRRFLDEGSCWFLLNADVKIKFGLSEQDFSVAVDMYVLILVVLGKRWAMPKISEAILNVQSEKPRGSAFGNAYPAVDYQVLLLIVSHNWILWCFRCVSRFVYVDLSVVRTKFWDRVKVRAAEFWGFSFTGNGCDLPSKLVFFTWTRDVLLMELSSWFPCENWFTDKILFSKQDFSVLVDMYMLVLSGFGSPRSENLFWMFNFSILFRWFLLPLFYLSYSCIFSSWVY